ncbi:MAG: putative zinc-binding protein [Methanoregula sp.]|nr:putative zinc-binding protein [Methanoregula sp.]
MTEDSHPSSECLIFSCSGASNVGVLSFQAAIRLAQEGVGQFSCIAGIGSKNLQMIRAVKLAGERMVIDGCPIGCAKKIMDANLIPIDRYVIVTELGIDKTHDFDVDDSDLETVVEAVKRPQEGSLPVNRLGEKRVKGGEGS